MLRFFLAKIKDAGDELSVDIGPDLIVFESSECLFYKTTLTYIEFIVQHTQVRYFSFLETSSFTNLVAVSMVG